MSYADLLNQHANKMVAVRDHEQKAQMDQMSKKAGSLRDKYNQITGALQQGADISSNVGMAYTAGRKVYKKMLGKKTAATGESDTATPSSTTSEPVSQVKAPATQGQAQPAGEQGPRGDGTDAPRTSLMRDPKTSTDEAAGEGAANTTAEEASSANKMVNNASTASQEGKLIDPAGEARGVLQKEGQDWEAIKGGDYSSLDPASANSVIQGSKVSPNTASQITDGDGKSVGNLANKAVSKWQKTATTKAPTAGDEGGEGAEPEADALPEAASEGIGSQALDWLGPIGMGIGAVGGLADLFESVFNKPKTTAEVTPQLATQGGGMDVKSLAAAQTGGSGIV